LNRAARYLLPGLVAGVLGAQVHGVRTADLDPSTPPCADFYRYANGGRIRAEAAPADRLAGGALGEVAERAGSVLREVLEDAAASRAPEGTVPRQLGDFFASGMDTAAIARAGLAPLREGLARIDGVRDLSGVGREVARLHLAGAGAAFLLTVGPDGAHPPAHLAHLAPGGLGMASRDAYLGEGNRGARAAYLDYLARLFTLAGETPALARAHAAIAFDLERGLAGVSRPPAASGLRISREDLLRLAPGFPWQAYFEAAGLDACKAFGVCDPGFLAGLGALAAATPAPQWRIYLKARLLDASAPYLGEAFEEASWRFHGAGRPAIPRWRRVLAATDAALGSALGQMYVARTFAPRSRSRAQALAAGVRDALRMGIQGRADLDPRVRDAALARLDALTMKVGYPDAFPDDPALRVNRADYLGNVQRAAASAFRARAALLGRPVDPSRWPVSPAAVTLRYEAGPNELVVPAGILQPPLFDARADDAANLKGIGVLMARELTRDGAFPGPGGLEGDFTAPPGQRQARPMAPTATRQAPTH